jgi:cobalt/nickel transport system permease protein
MALPAVACHHVFGLGMQRTKSGGLRFLLAAAAGGFAIAGSGLMTAGALFMCGRELMGTAAAVLVAHIPVVVVESLVAGSAAAFLLRTQPGMLRPEGSRA